MRPKKVRCPMCRGPHTLLRSDPVGVLRRTPSALARVLRGARKRWLARRPGSREWAINEVLAHLADAEVALGFRIRKIAAEPDAPIAAWDQDAWAEKLKYRTADATAVLDAFGAVRASNLEVLARLSQGQRQQSGRHPEYGKITLDQVVAHWAEHDLTHTNQIRSTLQTLSGRP